MGDSCPLHTRLGAWPVHYSLWRKLQAPLASYGLWIFAFLAQTTSSLVLFNWGLRLRSSSDASAEALLWGLGRRGNFWRYFSPLWLSSQYFHIHSSSHLLSGPRFHKIAGVFCLGSLNSETMTTCVLIHLFLTGMPLHGREKKGAVGAFFWGGLASCFYYHISD